jgi:hypothetical protein
MPTFSGATSEETGIELDVFQHSLESMPQNGETSLSREIQAVVLDPNAQALEGMPQNGETSPSREIQAVVLDPNAQEIKAAVLDPNAQVKRTILKIVGVLGLVLGIGVMASSLVVISNVLAFVAVASVGCVLADLSFQSLVHTFNW